MSLHSIQISESVCTRLAIYADKQGVTWEQAIDNMLTECSREDSRFQSRQTETVFSGRSEIVFLPNKENFKRDLLETKRAFVRLFYSDGHTETKTWNAQNFRENSDVVGNLRSGYLRDSAKKGIVKAEVSVEPFGN